MTRGDIEITSRTLDDQLWTVAYLIDDGPMRYYLYDHDKKRPRSCSRIARISTACRW